MKNRNIKSTVLIALFSILSYTANAQNKALKVGTNPTIKEGSAAFEVESTDKGLLVPRVALFSTLDVTTIASPANALTVFNTATSAAGSNSVSPGYYYFSKDLITPANSKWIKLFDANTPKSSWDLTGNAGTTASTNFIGTIDNNDFVVKTNNIEREHTFAIAQAYINSSNVIKAISGGDVEINGVTVGLGGGQNTTNTVVGPAALFVNSTGWGNVAVGLRALRSNTTGVANTAVGLDVLKNNIDGGSNTGLGLNALYENKSGNTNTAIGYSSLFSVSTGSGNTALGMASGNLFSSGSNNTIIGNLAGSNNSIGSNNIALGNSTDFPDSSGSNQMNIGNAIFGTGMTGTAVAPAGKIGIGSAAPSNTFHVKATADPVRFEGLQTGVATDKVVVADGDGVLKTVARSTFDADLKLIDGNHISADAGMGGLGTSTTGSNQIAIGNSALGGTTSNDNIAIGNSAAINAKLDFSNIIIGNSTANKATMGYENIIMGTLAATNATDGNYNVMLGSNTGAVNSGDYNIYIGDAAGFQTSGSDNTFLGASAGRNLTSGSKNIALGKDAALALPTADNQLSIGNTIYGTNLGSATNMIGIGVNNPTNTFHVKSTANPIRLEGLQPSAVATENVLVTDATGVLKTITRASLSANSWNLLGNAGTTPATNFLGTTDAQDLVFRTNNLERLRVTKTGRLDFSNTSGSSSNTFIEGGNETTTGINNTLIGFAAANNITTGKFNVAVGSSSLNALTTGLNNIVIGVGSANSVSSANSNIVIGNNIMPSFTTGDENIFIGNNSANQATSGGQNTFLGFLSGTSFKTGFNNTMSGSGSGSSFISGNSNTFFGTGSGGNLTTGDLNIAIGRSTNLSSATGSNQLNLGNVIFGTGLTGTVVAPAGFIGIDISAPTNTLHVKATANPVRFEGLLPSAVATENVVVTDATGVLKTVTSASLSANSWNLLGNAGTTPATNFLGTTDAQDLVFRTNNLERLRVTKTGRLDFSNTSGSSSNTFIEGGNETATGLYNTTLGVGAATNITSGNQNVALGSQALLNLSSGSNNVSIGDRNSTAITTGFSNVSIGAQAMVALTSGNGNTIIGNTAGSQVTGNNNTLLGVSSGSNLTTGGANIAIGINTNLPSATANYQLNIGNNIFGTGLSGSTTTPAGLIGIGIIAPTNTLHVKATANPVRFEGLLPSAVATENVLVTDATGVLKTVTSASLKGGDYSATEQLTSKFWIDGTTPVYWKSIAYTLASNSTTFDLSSSFTANQLKRILSIRVINLTNNGISTEIGSYDLATNKFVMGSGNSFFNMHNAGNYEIIIEYLK